MSGGSLKGFGVLEHAYAPETALPYLMLLVEALKAVGWPVAIVFMVWWLRVPILSLIPRINSLKAPGLEVGLDSAKESQIAKTEPRDLRQVSVVAGLPKTDAIIALESQVRNELPKYPRSEHEDLLINAVAVLNLEKHFSLVYMNIFGSQIRALQAINERGGQISLTDAEEGFEEIKQAVAELRDWTLERYTAYLESNGLLVRDSNKIKLTPVGRDFISFLVRHGLSTQKPL